MLASNEKKAIFGQASEMNETQEISWKYIGSHDLSIREKRCWVKKEPDS